MTEKIKEELLKRGKIMKIYVAHSSKWKFKENLYNPMKESNILKQNKIFFPHDEINNHIKTKEIIRESDLIIAEVSLPATGLGIELGWADNFGIPILCIYQKGQTCTSSLKFVTNNFIEYNDKTDMIDKIQIFLKNMNHCITNS